MRTINQILLSSKEMKINKRITSIYKAFMLVNILTILILFTWPADAWIPNEYKPNYETSTSRDTILWTFVEMDAANKIWKQLPKSKFSDLNSNFQRVFPKYPQDYSFKVVYEQCIQLSNDLSKYTSDQYLNSMTSFVNNCQKKLTEIIKKFNSEYTVIANVKASPQAWNAPFTVTLDARSSVDPSNETIPSDNFYRYYRDTKGVDQTIWKGLVLSHTFTQPWTYLVHLTVRSSNKQSKNIFDWEDTVSISVSPKTANISIYANWQKFKKDKVVKVGTQEAKKWIVFDATSTLPMWWRQIMNHIWTITSKDSYRFYRENEWKPGLVRVSLPSFGEYAVQLTTVDNEGNKVTEKYTLSVADPIAIIKSNPEEKWNTSTTFSFESSASYSVISNIRLYRREIFDANWDKLDTYQWKSIRQNFKKPGSYTIKLTVEDELGQTNSDSIQIYVDSTEPIAQFTYTPFDNSKSPSKFIFDASVSSDIDVQNWSDSLSYERVIPEAAKAKIVDTQDNNQKITVIFDNIWKYKVKLIAKDKYGKIWEMEKEVSILSTLRPEVIVRPQATSRWNDVLFVVKSDKKLVSYVRDLWDQNIHTIQEDRIKHKYEKAGVYNVVLKVSWENWEENEIYTNAFIWEKNYPIAWYKVVDSQLWLILRQNDTCNVSEGRTTTKVPAYQIDRQREVQIDPSLSANTKGDTTRLSYYFQPKDSDIVKQTLYKKKFDELGCTFIDFTVDDEIVAKQSKTRVRFKVVNSLPKLDNIVLVFPQYGNEMWIGFSQNNVQDTFSQQYDPLIVKTVAQNPIDIDSQISYFKRYYYNKNTPDNLLEVKITPGDIPYAFFSVPRIAGEYMFWVTIYDIDWWYQSSESIIWNWPIVFFPPDSSKPDIPIVTLRTTESSVKVWEEVQFDVISSILSDRADFIKERTIYYDFDWDGTRDKITKDDRVSHTYNKPSPESGYKPRAAVLYRWYKWTANGQNIVVQKWLKPMFLFESFDKTIILRDISIWELWTKQICMDIKTCKTNEEFSVDTWDYLLFKYPSYGKYYINIDLTDKYANKAGKRLPVDIQTGTSDEPVLLSIPKASTTSWSSDIFVWKNLDNTVLFYILSATQNKCYIDLDIKVDSDGDKIPDNDSEFLCNQLYYKKYEQKYESILWKIFYQTTGWTLSSKEFRVSFLDFEADLDLDMQKVYDDINLLLWTLNTWLSLSGYDNFRTLLTTLRDGLIDKSDTKSNVVSLKDYVNKQVDLKLDSQQQWLLNSIFLRLSDKSVVAAEGWSKYQESKAEIMLVIPDDWYSSIDLLFQEFEAAVADTTGWSDALSQLDKRKAVLQKIIDAIRLHTAAEGVTPKDNEIDSFDFENTIKPNICEITEFYNITTKACPSVTDDIKEVPEDVKVQTENNSWSAPRLKIVLRVVWGLIVWFLLLIVIFAIRAKIRQNQEDTSATTWETPSQ